MDSFADTIMNKANDELKPVNNSADDASDDEDGDDIDDVEGSADHPGDY